MGFSQLIERFHVAGVGGYPDLVARDVLRQAGQGAAFPVAHQLFGDFAVGRPLRETLITGWAVGQPGCGQVCGPVLQCPDYFTG